MDMPMNPTDPLAITLQAQEWNVVMAALNEAPLPARLGAAMVIARIARQFEQRPMMPGNGKDVLAEFQENLSRRHDTREQRDIA